MIAGNTLRRGDLAGPKGYCFVVSTSTPHDAPGAGFVAAFSKLKITKLRSVVLKSETD